MEVTTSITEEVQQIKDAINTTPEATNQTIASFLSEKISYEPLKDVLIKPLEPIIVEKAISTPVVKDTIKEEGEEINEYDEVKTETVKVESNFARGIILKLPPKVGDQEWPFKLGDTIIYNKRFSIPFDIFKDSVLVKTYDVIAIEK